MKCESDFDLMKYESDFDLMKCESVFDLMTCESVFWLEETWISLWRDEKWIRFWPDEMRFSVRHKGLSEAACLYHFVLSCSAPLLWNRSADSNIQHATNKLLMYVQPSTEQKEQILWFHVFRSIFRLPWTLWQSAWQNTPDGYFNFHFENVENGNSRKQHDIIDMFNPVSYTHLTLPTKVNV